MTIAIHLEPEIEARLRELARKSGLTAEEAAMELLEARLDSPPPQTGSTLPSPENDAEETDAELLAALKAMDDPKDDGGEESALDRALAAMRNRTPEQIAEMRERVLAATRPPRSLPPGKTLADVIVGKWPGNETDEQIQAALEELS